MVTAARCLRFTTTTTRFMNGEQCQRRRCNVDQQTFRASCYFATDHHHSKPCRFLNISYPIIENRSIVDRFPINIGRSHNPHQPRDVVYGLR